MLARAPLVYSAGELTHPRSLLTPLSHMLLAGAFQGRVEISAEACQRFHPGCHPPSPLSPGIRHLLPGCEEWASHLASILGFYKPGLAQSPSMGRDPRVGDLPLKPNAFSKAWFFSLLPSGDLSPAPCDDPWETCGGAGDACLSLVLPRGTWGKGVTPS